MWIVAKHDHLIWQKWSSTKQISCNSKTNIIWKHFLVHLDFELHEFNCISIWLHCSAFTKTEHHEVNFFFLQALSWKFLPGKFFAVNTSIYRLEIWRNKQEILFQWKLGNSLDYNFKQLSFNSSTFCDLPLVTLNIFFQAMKKRLRLAKHQTF